MKSTIFLTLGVLLFANYMHAQSDTVRGNQFTLTGTLIEEVPETAFCGVIAWAAVVELSVSHFSCGDYLLDSVAVVLCCPSTYRRDFFELGQSYSLTVVDENQADFFWTIVNEPVIGLYEKHRRFWVLDIEKADD